MCCSVLSKITKNAHRKALARILARSPLLGPGWRGAVSDSYQAGTVGVDDVDRASVGESDLRVIRRPLCLIAGGQGLLIAAVDVANNQIPGSQTRGKDDLLTAVRPIGLHTCSKLMRVGTIVSNNANGRSRRNYQL